MLRAIPQVRKEGEKGSLGRVVVLHPPDDGRVVALEGHHVHHRPEEAGHESPVHGRARLRATSSAARVESAGLRGRSGVSVMCGSMDIDPLIASWAAEVACWSVASIPSISLAPSGAGARYAVATERA